MGDKQTGPLPGVHVGDHVYYRDQSGACTGCVVSCGKHGVTVDGDGGRRQVQWENLLGHKQRMRHDVNVVDEGEDGAIVEHEGRRIFLRHPEAQVRKAQPAMALFMKAGPLKDRPGLSLRNVTDKAGHQTKRWQRTAAEHPKGEQRKAAGETAPRAKVGESVHVDKGSLKGPHKVVAAGKDGATVADEQGNEHAVEWQYIKPAAGKPDYAPRQDGESDRAYAKRAIDAADAPQHLPEDHERYFDTQGADKVPLDRLHSTKSDEENAGSGERGAKRMLAAYHGAIGKRAPITVMPHSEKSGHYEVVDGNGTLTAARTHGWQHLPVKVVSREDGEASIDRDRAVKVGESRSKSIVNAADYEALPAKAAQPTRDPDEIYQKAEEALGQLKQWLGTEIAGELGLTTMPKTPGKVAAEEWDQHKGMLFIAPLKKRDGRATEKVNADYGGDWSKLLDVVRCTVAVDNMDDMADVIAALKERGMEPVQRPKNKFGRPTESGYRDLNFVVRMPNGIAAEVQINVKDMLRAKNEAHQYYEITRKIEDANKVEGALADYAQWPEADRKAHEEASDKQREIYDTAWLEHVQKHYGSRRKALKSWQRVVLFLGGRR